MMKPFFSYFGSKYRLAKHYPAPLAGVPVVEPFAGSAAYSVYYDAPEVILYDANPVICGIWDYLIRASVRDISGLPDKIIEHVDEASAPQEAKALIGFWLAKARGAPATRAGPWSKNFYSETNANVWGPAVKARIARQLPNIRAWRVINAAYHTAPAIRATWFIDLPYVTTARNTYVFKDINYAEVAAFSLDRQGLVINCDDISARYLAFRPFKETQGVLKKSYEAVYIRKCDVPLD